MWHNEQRERAHASYGEMNAGDSKPKKSSEVPPDTASSDLTFLVVGFFMLGIVAVVICVWF